MDHALLQKTNQPSDPIDVSHQKMEAQIQGFLKCSRYQREKMPDGREKISSPELGEFFLRRFTDSDPNSPKLKQVCDLISTFDEEEVDLKEIGRNVDSKWYCYSVVEDAKGDIIGLLQGTYLEFLKGADLEALRKENLDTSDIDGPFGESKNSLLFIGYLIMKKEGKNKDLAKELLRHSLEYCQMMAKGGARGYKQNFRGAIAEETGAAELLFNAGGLKRIYFEDAGGNFHEVPYLQPPLQWENETGRPVDPETEEIITHEKIKNYCIPEHLMLNLSDGRNELQAEGLLKIVESIYEDNYTGRATAEDEYHPAVIEQIKKIYDELKIALSQAKDGKLHLWGKKERRAKSKELAKQEKSVFEHKAEDD